MASGEFPFPHFLEPREPVNLEPQVLPWRLGGRPPPQPPAGDSFPRETSPACIARTSRAKQASRVKKMVSWTFHSENSLLAVSPSHLHPPAPPHSRFPLPLEIQDVPAQTSAPTSPRVRMQGFVSLFRRFVKLCGVESPRRGFLRASLFQSSRGAGVVVIVRTAQAWAPGVVCVAFCLQAWVGWE